MSSYENLDSFEWKFTDDETLERIFCYFQKDIHQYQSWHFQNWYQGLYTKDGKIFLTCMDTINGNMLRTGGDADEWFYYYFLVLAENQYGIRMEGTADYQERFDSGRHKGSVSDNLKEYRDIIVQMMEVYQSAKNFSLEYPGGQDEKEHRARVEKYRTELDRLAGISRGPYPLKQENDTRRAIFRISDCLPSRNKKRHHRNRHKTQQCRQNDSL